MKNLVLTTSAWLADRRVRLIIFAAIGIGLLLLSTHASATDLLAGTDTDVSDTAKGTGRTWMYWLDGGASLIAFAFKKNPAIFFSILGVAAFFTVLTKMTGHAA